MAPQYLEDDGQPMCSPIVLAKSERPSEQEQAAAADSVMDTSNNLVEKKNDARKIKETKSMEIRKQLEAKKAKLLAIQKESEELLKKQ